MTDRDKEREYETVYETSGVTSNPTANTELVVAEVPEGGQLSQLHITASEANEYYLESRDLDGSNPSLLSAFSGVDKLTVGTFEDPVAKVGAQKEIAVIVVNDSTTDNNYSANLVVDRHVG
jgi:hypothetical protein